MVLESINNASDIILRPLLGLPPWLAILIFSAVLSLLLTVMYKYLTDQETMKRIKKRMKELQDLVKKQKENPTEAMKLQKEMMDLNLDYMMKSMKPTFITLIPIIFVIGWMNAHYTYEPIEPGSVFTAQINGTENLLYTARATPPLQIISSTNATGQSVTFSLQGPRGDYYLDIDNGKNISESKKIIVDQVQRYADPLLQSTFEIRILQKELIVLNLFGWELGWLGSYIIFSILFSMGFRKVMDVH